MSNKRIMISALLAVCMNLFASQGWAKAPADSVKHSTIVDADGYVFLSEDKTLSEMRAEATAEAKRAALEKCETYIKSLSKVENFQLQYDLIESASEGFVTIIESKDHGLTDDNRYHVWIKAEVAFRPKSSATQASAVDIDPLSVKVWLDKDVYKEGDQIKIYLESNRDCHVRVLHVSAEGQVLQLLPNPHRKESLCKQGVTVQIPNAKDAFKLEVVPPFGREEIVVYASTEPLGDISLSESGSGLYIAQASSDVIAEKTRGIRITPVESRPVQAAEFVELRRSIMVEAK